jgi:hypothetical protein
LGIEQEHPFAEEREPPQEGTKAVLAAEPLLVAADAA